MAAAQATLKALRESITPNVIIAYQDGRTVEEILADADLGALDDLVGPVSQALRAVLADSGARALESLSIDDSGLFDLVNKDAIEFAEARAAELVGRKLVDGQLVDNPDARWAISESTRDGLRDLVERAYSEGLTPAQLEREIRQAYGFSKKRARMIARTETARASVQGNLNGWKRSGVVVGKIWLLSNDHDESDCDVCDDNIEAGEVALDEDFPSGDAGPPAHPNCRCSIAAVLSKDPSDEDEV